MTDVFTVAELLVESAKKVAGDSVGLIAYSGSYAKGTASKRSDLDIFYVPDKGKEGLLDVTFILDDLPYDFWGPSWKMLEEIANARSRRPWAVSASLVADARPLYYRSADDRRRFETLQERIHDLTQPENRSYMVSRSLEEFDSVLARLGQMRLAHNYHDVYGMHWAGWQFVTRAINCLALVNQIYFSKGWGANTDQILQMESRPDDLENMLEGILLPVDSTQALEWAERLAEAVRSLLHVAQAEIADPVPRAEIFTDFYYYFQEYAGKVRSACEKGDVLAASSAAFSMQELISGLMNLTEEGLYSENFNLLDEYASAYRKAGFPNLLKAASQGDFEDLSQRVDQLEEASRRWFIERSLPLNILESVENLELFLKRRYRMKLGKGQ